MSDEQFLRKGEKPLHFKSEDEKIKYYTNAIKLMELDFFVKYVLMYIQLSENKDGKEDD